MKIDTDLRIAIRAAEKAQPSSDYSARQKQRQNAIDEFFSRFPSKAKRIAVIVTESKNLKRQAEEKEAQLCKQYGLREYNGVFEIAGCGTASGAFEKAGGKLPIPRARVWKSDEVIAELVVAEPSQQTRILKKYGIVWK